ncbi:MATE family efflux transporter [Phyllobacterium myrsinacearum]|uniref:Multidrug-efflux transporter n=1 Tax=Phyllobacterium myrsinacearum TaxID=28101 RepID=A0A2S9JJM7_9HYPH|nr:MATE family efflux transporter [Phyllobacterium myrsinacearum]PRD53277.1 MATE family efflux transporter [Phyllobacterium myrsinacearum]PWV93858.1 MATE family multidrug resistance protein [Phyllobacterium myrsinacearum]RZV07703.1 MATE family multidrug resistance protein [Phyllobacterium myrsinacearum]
MSALPTPNAAPKRAWRDEIIAMLALSWPMILTNLAQTAMTATDVMMMGWVSAHTLAAGALGTNLYYVPMIFGLGLMLATSPMMARELGRNKYTVREIRRTVRQGLWIAVTISIPIWCVLWNTQHILTAMGQDPALAAEAGAYVRALQWAALPFYCYIVVRSFLAALERPGWALVIAILAVMFNALANWCLIFGHFGFPKLGIVGSGIATTLSSALMFIGLVIVVSRDRQFRRYRLFGRFWRADWARYGELLRLGLPIAAILSFEVTIFNAAAFLMGIIGPDSLAAHAIAIQIASISFMVPMGFGQAATVRIGRAYGAQDKDGIKRAGWVAFAAGTGFMVLTALLMLLAPHQLIRAFIDVSDPANAPVVSLAVSFLAFAALFQIFDGGQAVASGMLRGLHDTTIPMIYAAIAYWGIGLPLSVAFGFWLKLEGAGIWLGLLSGLAAAAILLMSRWLRREKLGIEIIRH